MISETIRNRKGARRVADVPQEVLGLLNTGLIESVNLVEWLSINHMVLVKNCLPDLGLSNAILIELQECLQMLKKPTSMKCTEAIGKFLFSALPESDRSTFFKKLSVHQSDSVRGYAGYLIALDSDLDIIERLEAIRPLANDAHFGVREVVWMAIRPGIEEHLDSALNHLQAWVLDPSPNIRRFATESTRPRGVWCKHIEALKTEPDRAQALLEPLYADESKYVQDSVANWLNDASKTRPDFVMDITERWAKSSQSKSTAYIVKRARRSMKQA